jgi:ABC-type multidrug transport system fused ATPase/permease subunit
LEFIRNVWLFIGPYRANLKKALAWTLAMQVLALVEPYLLMFIIDDVTHHGVEALPRVPWMAAGAFVLLIGTTITKILKDRRIRNITVAICTEVENRVFAKFMHLSLTYHHGTNAGESVSKAREGARRLDEITWITLFELAPMMLQAVIVTCVLLYWHWTIALLVIGTMLVTWTYLYRTKRRWHENRQERWRLARRVDRDNSESVANVMTVQAYGREEQAISDDMKKQDRWKQLFMAELNGYDRGHLLRNGFINLMRVCSVLICVHYYFEGTMTVGQWVLVQMLVERLFNANFQLGGIYDRFVDAAEPVRILASVMNEPETQPDPEQPLPIPTGPLTLSLKDVAYAYPSRPDQPVLSDVNLKIKPGSMVGIVGESGHGKTTLAKFLLRFYDPAVGSVSINGVDLRQLKKSDARKLIGYVPQEVELFNATIAENIRYGAMNATDEEVRRAATLARALPFIEKTEKGFATQIGDRGLRLSGGERQRIGIARAVLTGAPIMIFDEATSSVDAETIFEIKRAMNELRRERTLIVITHQLSTVQDADQLVVLKDGRIDGMGNHSELLRSNETYKGFVQRQQNADSALHVVGHPKDVS